MKRTIIVLVLLALCASAQTLSPEQQFAQDAAVAIAAASKAQSDGAALLSCQLNYLQAEIAGQPPLACVPPNSPDAAAVQNDNLAAAAAVANVGADMLSVWQQQDVQIASLQAQIANLNSQITSLQSTANAQAAVIQKLQKDVAALCAKFSVCPYPNP